MIRILDQAGEEDISEKDLVDTVKLVFQEQGILEAKLGFEYREEQAKMAVEVLDSLIKVEHLIFEAGTGVGKSLAYLVPSLLYAKKWKRPCVVATNTISLQEQLLNKDIPDLRKIIREVSKLSSWADFECALLVGRANYLCPTRLQKALVGQTEIFDGRQREELERIATWAKEEAREGIRQELSPAPMGSVWDMVNADSSLCSSKRCSSESCFYRKARLEVERADLVIVNHSLLFSLLGAGFGPESEEGGVMFANDFVIFDEAHEMPDVASDHLGLSLSSWAIESALNRLHNPRKGKGLISKKGRPGDLESVDNAATAVGDFFQHLHMGVLGERDRIRLMDKGALPMEVFPPLSKVTRNLIELAEASEDESLKLELRDQARRMQGFLTGLSDLVELKDENSVYWVERTGKKNQIIHLRSAPLDIAQVLDEELFKKQSSIVMTSATITRKKDPAYFSTRIGANTIRQVKVNSPFDYISNMRVCVMNDCPDPTTRDRSPYLKYLTEAIYSLAAAVEGGTLVLFTNYSDLQFCYHTLMPRWKRTGRSLYAQGEGYSRSELRSRMMSEGDVLLLGAESFWKGFDAKGPSLSQLIITRLPFENPNHPVLEAKSEIFEKKGKNPFMEMTLPSAVIRFRQGVGRLIRSNSDIGELFLLDSRILKKNYGREFLSELPKTDYEVLNISEICDII